MTDYPQMKEAFKKGLLTKCELFNMREKLLDKLTKEKITNDLKYECKKMKELRYKVKKWKK